MQCAVKGSFLNDGRAMYVRGLVSPFSHNAEGTKTIIYPALLSDTIICPCGAFWHAALIQPINQPQFMRPFSTHNTAYTTVTYFCFSAF